MVIAVGVRSALGFVLFVRVPAAWARWADVLRADASGAGTAAFTTVGWYLPVPLLPRLVAAVLVAGAAGLTGRRWVLPIAVVLAMPVVWGNSLAVLAACVPLWRVDRTARSDRTFVA